MLLVDCLNFWANVMDGNGLIIKVSEISTNIFHGPAVASGGRGRRRDEDDDIPAGGGYHFRSVRSWVGRKITLILWDLGNKS